MHAIPAAMVAAKDQTHVATDSITYMWRLAQASMKGTPFDP